jgi:hypothetical protein
VTYVAGTAPANTDPLSVEFLRNGDIGYSTLINGIVGSFGALPTISTVGGPFNNAALDYFNGSASLGTTTTTATAVTSTGVLTVTSTATFVANGAFILSGTAFGGLSAVTTYYVTSILSSTQITFSTSQGGSAPGGLSTASGSMGWTSITSALALGSSGSFTIECWIYIPSLPAATVYVFNKDGVAGTNYAEYSIQLNSSGQLFFQTGNSTGAVSTSNYNISVISTNTWYHVAVMRSTTTIYLFLNGVLQNAGGTAQGTAPVSSNRNFYVGNQQGGGAAFTGYVSNLRVVIGSLVYSTAGFSVPLSQLGIVTNTQLLLNASLTTDSSNNFFVFTNTSTALVVNAIAGNSYMIANTGQLATYATGGYYNAGQIIGYNGSQGDKGALRYTFNTTTTSASNPGNGDIRYNNATIASVTAIYISNTIVAGTDVSSFIATWANSSNPSVKGQLVISDNINSVALVNTFTVSAVSAGTGFYTLTVAYVSGTLPTNSEPLSVQFTRSGDLGYTGSIGLNTSIIALSDESSNISVGYLGSRGSFWAPYAMTLSAVPKLTLNVAGTTTTTVDMLVGATPAAATSILSTKLTLTNGYSGSAATPAVLTTNSIPNGYYVQFIATSLGSGAAGLKVTVYY